MKRIYLLLLLALPVLATGQQQVASGLSLEQCLEYALDSNVRARNAMIDQQIAAAKVRETIGIGLPQLTVNSGIVQNPTLPRFFTTYTGPGGFVGDLSGVPNLQVGDAIAAQNFFQLKAAGNASVTANQLIFNGSYLVGLKASSTFQELSIHTTEQTKQDIIQLVAKAYYSVVINRERARLFDDNIARVDTLLRNTIELNKNGFSESIDVDRVKVTRNNLIAQRDNFINMNELSMQLLKFQMGYPQNQPLDISGTIDDLVVLGNTDSFQEGWDYKNRPDYKVLEVNQRLQRLNLKNQYATGAPVLSAFATYGYSTQSSDVGGLFKTNSRIADENGLGPDKWYHFSQIGLNFTMPIFTGLSRSNRVQQEKLKLRQVDNNFANLKNSIDLEIKTASLNFENSLKILESQKENQDLAANVARVTKTKYEQGVGSSLEVTDAENALRNAQTIYYSALFDAMISKIDLDKAHGRLLPTTYKETLSINPGKK
jgi:outer membrane protein